MKKGFIIIATLLFASMMCGCYEDVINYTNFNTAIYEQTFSNGSYTHVQSAEVYAFAADTTEWKIVSLEDAQAHVITNKLTGEKRDMPDAFGSFNPSQEYQSSVRLEQSTSMIVVVLPESGIYAYRNYQLPENLEKVDTKLYIAHWRPSHSIAGWRVVNEGYTPPTAE